MIKNKVITVYNNVPWDKESIDVPLFFDTSSSLSDSENIIKTRDDYFKTLNPKEIKGCGFIGDSLFAGEINIHSDKLFSNTYISFVNVNNNKTFYYFVRSVSINNISENKTSTTISIELDLWTTFHEEFFTTIKGSFVANRYTDKRYKKIGTNWYFDYSKNKDVWNIDGDFSNLTTYGVRANILQEECIYTVSDLDRGTYVNVKDSKNGNYTNRSVYFTNGNAKDEMIRIGRDKNGDIVKYESVGTKYNSGSVRVQINVVGPRYHKFFYNSPYKYIAVNQKPYQTYEINENTKKESYVWDKTCGTSYAIKASPVALQDKDSSNFVSRINEKDFIPPKVQAAMSNFDVEIDIEKYVGYQTNDSINIDSKTPLSTLMDKLSWRPVDIKITSNTTTPIWCYCINVPDIRFSGNIQINFKTVFTFSGSPFMNDAPSIKYFKNKLTGETANELFYIYDGVDGSLDQPDKDELWINDWCMNDLTKTKLVKTTNQILDDDYKDIDIPSININDDNYNYLLEPQIWMSHCYKTSLIRNGKEYNYFNELGEIKNIIIYSKYHMGGLYERIIATSDNKLPLTLSNLKGVYSFNFDNTKASVSDSYSNYIQNNKNSLETGIYGAEKNIEFTKKLGTNAMNTVKWNGLITLAGATYAGASKGMEMGGVAGAIAGGGLAGTIAGVSSHLNKEKVKTQVAQSNFNAQQQLKNITAQQKDLFNSPDKMLNGSISSYEREINNGVVDNIFQYNNPQGSTSFWYLELPTVSTLKGYSDYVNRMGYISGNQLYNMNIRELVKRKYFNYWEVQDISTAILEPKLNPYVFNYFREKFNIGVRLWNTPKGKIKDYSKQNWDEGIK
ncbi:MAG: hypothetical protein ACRCUM_02350 [Mycoplasmoidaceae bacterium]